MMIRSSIIALNQANQTGNYTVLQDLGAPAFRSSNNSARLAQVFTQLRQRNLDLSPVLFFSPKLVQQPKIAPNGLLRLVGYFPTTPEQVNFDLYFQQVAGEWRVFGIGLSTSPIEATAAIPPVAQPSEQNAPAGQPQQSQTAAAGAKEAAPKEAAPAPAKQTAKNEKAPQPARKPAPAPKATPPAAKAEPPPPAPPCKTAPATTPRGSTYRIPGSRRKADGKRMRLHIAMAARPQPKKASGTASIPSAGIKRFPIPARAA